MPVHWIWTFLRGRQGTITRKSTVYGYFGNDEAMTVTTDACPWGLGGFLTIQGEIREFLSSEFCEGEAKLLGVTRGENSAQQTVVALVVLVVLRLRAPHWRDQRALLRVKSDSASALTSVVCCRATGTGTSIIARELSLDIAEAVYRPEVAEHIPGVANVTVDAPPRLFILSSSYTQPAWLSEARYTRPPRRDALTLEQSESQSIWA